MSYQYPYIEHYSPSPATSTPQQPFAQWADVQDDPSLVSPINPQVQGLSTEQDQNQLQQQQQQQQASTPTYEAPQVIQLVERPLRRPKQQQRQVQAHLQNQVQQNQNQMPSSMTTASAQHTSPPTGAWFDLRDTQSSKSSTSSSGKDSQVRQQVLANRAQQRLASHPYYRHTVSGDKTRRERQPAGVPPLVPIAPNSASLTVMACGGPTISKTNADGSTSPSPLSSPVITFGAPVQVRRLIIRTDVHFNAETNSMTVMLELPGIKKTDLTLTLWTCPYSRVKQLTVRGRLSPLFADEGYTVRERKYGEFKRILVVPPDTKPSDIKVTMEDGILILKYPAATQHSEPQEFANIPIH